MASVLDSAERAVRVQALTGYTVLCSWARHLTLTVPLSPPRCINGYRRGKFNAGDNHAMD